MTQSSIEQIGNRIAAAREDSRLTQREVAAALGITRQAYANIESGRSAASVAHLAGLAHLFNQTADYFLGGAGLDESEQKLIGFYREFKLAVVQDVTASLMRSE